MIKIVTGHFGSGKTEIAINMAMGKPGSTIVDLDIVNPYFRTADSAKALCEAGVRTIIPEFANSNVDMPTLPSAVLSVFNSDADAVFDVGGDDNGATALGMYNNYFKNTEYEMYFVICTTRPLTANADEIIDMMKSVERASRLNVTHLINNTHLSKYTVEETVLGGQALVEEVSKKTGVPIAFTAVKTDLAKGLRTKIDNPVYGLDLYTKLPF